MAVGFWRWIRISSPVEKDLWQKMLPSDSREFPLWIAVSATAGIFEEIAYRATLPYIVADAISPNHDDALGMAVIISIVAFGLAHAYQGWRGILGTSLFAFEMHLIMFISGSLLICMCVHFLTDLSIGALYFNAVRKGQILAITATTAT